MSGNANGNPWKYMVTRYKKVFKASNHSEKYFCDLFKVKTEALFKFAKLKISCFKRIKFSSRATRRTPRLIYSNETVIGCVFFESTHLEDSDIKVLFCSNFFFQSPKQSPTLIRKFISRSLQKRGFIIFFYTTSTICLTN